MEASESQPGEPGAAPGVDEAELQRRLEEQMRKVRVQDLLSQSVASASSTSPPGGSPRRTSATSSRPGSGSRRCAACVELLEPEAAARSPQGPLAAADALRQGGRGRRRRARRRQSRQRSRRWPARLSARPASGPRRVPERGARQVVITPTASLHCAPLRGRNGVPAVPTSIDTPEPEDSDLTDFLTDYGVLIALVCAGAGVLYGALVTQRLLRAFARQRADAGDLRRRPGGRQGLPEPPVHDHRRRRDPARDPDRADPGRSHRRSAS